jgi:glycosyltransferase involved in cell wall biosynthesis/SAM-dependent methyltransferase
MRVAYFSPLPPARSGIADYSQALIEHLRPLLDLTVFSDPTQPFDPATFDAALYHIGNNPYHTSIYETALRHPGIVVLHEGNLHHLVADLTIRRGDWDAYLAECEYNGGSDALARAQRVRALEIGPDYEGVPMLRRLLERSRALIVHSRFVERQARDAGFARPIAVIPHGAWLPQANGHEYRSRLGLDETTPLIGIFGFLKPYKRIAECLRAFRRLLRCEPGARMLLAGEIHPDFPVESLIRSLGLLGEVRVQGYTPIEDFVGYTAACNVILNLRYPTAGESSGTLLRAFGLGKPALVSDLGSFSELPGDICLKVPLDASEEDLIFEYLNLLVSRPGIAREIGRRAREYVERECNWAAVAGRYAAYLRDVAALGASEVVQHAGPDPIAVPLPESVTAAEPHVTAEYLAGWVPPGEAREYLETHSTRLLKTIEITPGGGPGDRILEMGAYMQITPALKLRLGYGDVRGCYYGAAGTVERKRVTSAAGETFECELDLFDAEKDRFPYCDDWFSTVLCGELIEHLFEDPMHLMAEVNRILKPGGHLVLTTPNIASLRGISAILQGYHPGFFPAYIKPSPSGEVEPRHNREYTPREIYRLLLDAGFEVVLLQTGPFRDQPGPRHLWVSRVLDRFELDTSLRGDGIYAVGRKCGPVVERYPSWLYS